MVEPRRDSLACLLEPRGEHGTDEARCVAGLAAEATYEACTGQSAQRDLEECAVAQDDPRADNFAIDQIKVVVFHDFAILHVLAHEDH